MDLRPLTPELSVSPQIHPEELAALAAEGFRVVINNRPDAEVGPDENSIAMKAAAEAAGMEYREIPFVPGQVTPDMVEAQAEALALPGRKIAYCRSGNRSTVLWALSRAGEEPTANLIEAAAQAGYDLSGVRPLIDQIAARGR
ncbi:MAG TPA: TIGR01244 family sulfur transferase [Paracoccus sp. (in: a-proteobacteria)]|uniref:TIGR01244 family sulfur transferase n=1 Tax=Paracoccus sp. TaxID=267 RepID=UPI002B5EF393|nr:TIGR01244 family sulfur transferase [Paracoccus sp. (in: a-proteobacteria)]HWL58583.1 TIGR01244 family sulfur transferase [Paracoccus sp. (in: a-proteobacteria)]